MPGPRLQKVRIPALTPENFGGSTEKWPKHEHHAGSRAKSPAATEKAQPEERESPIYAVVRVIPRGRVATYGEVAELAGIPRGHRVAARAMQSCPEGLPWYRVVGKKDARRAQINIADPDHAEIQRARLEAEGVELDENGCIPLARFGMLHTEASRARVRVERKPRRR